MMIFLKLLFLKILFYLSFGKRKSILQAYITKHYFLKAAEARIRENYKKYKAKSKAEIK